MPSTKIDERVFDILVTIFDDRQKFVVQNVSSSQRSTIMTANVCGVWGELYEYSYSGRESEKIKIKLYWTRQKVIKFIIIRVHGGTRLIICLCLVTFKIWRSVVSDMKFPVWKLRTTRFGLYLFLSRSCFYLLNYTNIFFFISYVIFCVFFVFYIS